jgi:hypothetical protein
MNIPSVGIQDDVGTIDILSKVLQAAIAGISIYVVKSSTIRLWNICVSKLSHNGITIRRKNSQAPDKSNYSSIISNSKGKRFIVLGIVITVIGFAGAIFYGSQFVKEEVNAGGTLPYTISSHITSVLPIDLEIVTFLKKLNYDSTTLDLTFFKVHQKGKSCTFYPSFKITSQISCATFAISKSIAIGF